MARIEFATKTLFTPTTPIASEEPVMNIKRILITLSTAGFMFLMLASLPGARAADIAIDLNPAAHPG